MINYLKIKPNKELTVNLINEAIEIERKFLNQAIPVSLLKLTTEIVNQTIDKLKVLKF
jgi:hypothetical protein